MNGELLTSILENFHFLRPVWFYALIPALLLFIILKLRQGSGSNWEQTIDSDLLPYLIDEQTSRPSKNPISLVLIAWILAILALAGPVWDKTPQPVHEREDALIILLDLTRSMYTPDVKPNRLIRARRKMLDLLAMRKEGVTALIVYAGDAHTVTPLTDDTKTIAEMIPAVSPAIMPAPGSQLTPALNLAYQLFKDAGVASGRIIIVTDEIRDVAEAQSIARQYRNAYPISVLAVGTAEGAPIPGSNFSRDGGYLKDNNGTLIIPKVNFAALEEFARVSGGRYARMRLIDDDLSYLLADQPLLEFSQEQYREIERNFDVWFEEGPWLILLLLPLAAISFRRGWLWSVVLVCMIPVPRAEASLWDDFWQTRDQQGTRAMQDGDAALAAGLFKDSEWKATAQYRSEDFVGAAQTFANRQTETGHYNLGNSLAKQGQYEEAIDAYKKTIDLNPTHEDAVFNKQLVENLLQQQQQQQQDQEGNDDQKQNPEEGDQEQQSDGNQQQEEDSSEEDQQQEEQSQQEQDEQQAKDEKAAQDQAAAQPEPLDDEEQQALEQWLRRVPDDPGGLLRRKFELQYNERIKRGRKAQNDPSNW